MKGGNPIMFSRGIQITNINGDIQKKEYEAIYDGNKSKMLLNDGHQKHLIIAEDDDIQKLFHQNPSKQNIETKLKLLLNKPKKRKRKRRRRKKTKRIRFKIPSKKKKIHYTVRKRTPSKSKSRKSPSKKKTPSKSKSKKKSPSKKSTIQKLLPEKLLKTII
jgi:hypothetical protein